MTSSRIQEKKICWTATASRIAPATASIVFDAAASSARYSPSLDRFQIGERSQPDKHLLGERQPAVRLGGGDGALIIGSARQAEAIEKTKRGNTVLCLCT